MDNRLKLAGLVVYMDKLPPDGDDIHAAGGASKMSQNMISRTIRV